MAALPAVTGIESIPAIQANLALWNQRITLKKVGREHRYSIDGKAYPSVTTILGARCSPRLVDWSSRVEREACIEVAWRLAQGGGAYGLEYAGGILPDECKPAFIEQFTNEAGSERTNQKLLREAGELGTEVHSFIEWVLRKRMGQPMAEPQVSDRALSVAGGFEAWAEKVNLEPVVMEQRIVSTKHGYGGTLDLFAYATVDDTPRAPYVLDYKSGRGIYAEAHLQSGGYRAALVEMGAPEAGGLLLHLPKEGDKVGTVDVVKVTRPLPALMRAFLASKEVYDFYREEK